MKTLLPLAIGIALLGGCDRSRSTAPRAGSTVAAQSTALSAADPSPPAVPATPAADLREWQSRDGAIALRYPPSLVPTRDFSATYFTPEGWRAMFDGSPVGLGQGLVRFTAESKSGGDVPRIATDHLQIGTSGDAGVVADCLTRGLQTAHSNKQPDRMIGGLRFTVYRSSDAGMSHQLSSTDLRAVHNGRCIAIDRLTSSVPASVDVNARPDRLSGAVEKDFDAVMASLRFE